MRWIFFLIASLFVTGCFFMDDDKLDEIESYGYQLQNYDSHFEKTILNSKNRLWVIDYSQDGSPAKQWGKDKITKFKKDNLILSYLSIGEMEEYRFYYNENVRKELFVTENLNWPGNFVVKYWDKRWKDIIINNKDSYLNQILDMGFEGVYLDIVDSFDNFKDKKDKAEKMSVFVQEISKHRGGEHYTFIQNGAHIIDHLDKPEEFINAVSGVGIESLFFYGDKPMNNEFAPQKFLIKILEKYKAMNKPIFVIEYLDDEKKIKKFFEEAKKFGAIPLATDRPLKGKSFFYTEFLSK